MTENGIRRESIAAVFGIGVGLVVILLAVLSVLGLKPGTREGSAWLATQLVLPPDAPGSLEYAETLQFINGQTVVVLRDPSSPDEPEADPKPKPPSFSFGDRRKKSMGDWGGPKVDWSALPDDVAGGAPVEVAFAGYTAKRSKKALEGLFSGARYKSLEEIGGSGGEMPVAMGYLDWHGYEANYVHARQFEKVSDEPAFHDTVRVNLTVGPEALVLFARWPRGQVGDVGEVESILASYAPREPDDA